ncbi:MAG: hypothetical protein ACJ76H_01415, partial [Bacteriovoracaceae bacterium]
DCGATFQTYIFKLNPQIIVNDGVTLKGEFSSGYLRGGFAGDNASNGLNNTGGAYFFASPAQRSALNVNQMYMELYADTALIRIGRIARGYGMGIAFDAGTDAWDRFFTMYDGIDAEMKIGNFSVTPYYAKISSYDNNSAGTGHNNGARPAGGWDVRETGITAKYDNKARDLVVSVLYAKRFSEAKSSLYNINTDTTGAANGDLNSPTALGKTNVTVIEPYVSKKWNKFKVSAEGSLQSGDYGKVDPSSGNNTKLAASAYVGELKYELNPKWDIGANLGQVSGDKAGSGKFEAMYLHPNYHIADLMFRYNYQAFNQGGASVFDSSITNARYWTLYTNYKTDKWTWKGAFVMANAMETAKAGTRSFHHEERYMFNANQNQKKDYGYEFDLGFDYRWNPNVIISGYYGYWKVGDYYSYTNTSTKLGLVNVHGGGLRATLEF